MIGKVFEMIIGVPIILGIFGYVVWFFGTAVKMLTWDLYFHHKYTARGLCPKCHEPLEFRLVPTDQMYGSSVIKKPQVCSCGKKAHPVGNRRFAEW